MKTKSFNSILLLFFFFSSTSFAQPGWFTQTSPTNQTLNANHMLTPAIGWAVGNAGTIIWTANGGANWNLEQSGTSQALYLYF
jgi:photosystem II stability/assembly factor-like uncharacterized protein